MALFMSTPPRPTPPHTPAPRFATQSGPMLLIAGALHPAIQDDGPSRLVRNARREY